MIGRLYGKIEYFSEDHLLIDVQGVGYIVYCSERTLRSLPAVGEYTFLYTDLLVREDILQLFGFTSIVEKEWHRLLMTVQGVGAKAALAIMGALGADGLNRSISIGDWAAVKQAKGIGPKTAQRVVNELKEKAPQIMAMAAVFGQSAVEKQSLSLKIVKTMQIYIPRARWPIHWKKYFVFRRKAKKSSRSFISFKNLGYSPSEAANAIALASDLEETVSTPDIIKKALLLSPNEN